MTKHRLNEYAIFSAEGKVIDLYEFETEAEQMLAEYKTSKMYEGASIRSVIVTVESVADMKRNAIDAIKSVMTDYEIEADSSFHFEGLHAAIDLLEGIADD